MNRDTTHDEVRADYQRVPSGWVSVNRGTVIDAGSSR
jgi:hypothetical protein